MAHRFRTQPARTSNGQRYGPQHQAARRQAAARHQPTDPCARHNDPDIHCHRPLGPMGPWLHYDHDEHGGYRGFSHAPCNKRAAAIKGNRIANKRKTRAQSRAW